MHSYEFKKVYLKAQQPMRYTHIRARSVIIKLRVWNSFILECSYPQGWVWLCFISWMGAMLQNVVGEGILKLWIWNIIFYHLWRWVVHKACFMCMDIGWRGIMCGVNKVFGWCGCTTIPILSLVLILLNIPSLVESRKKLIWVDFLANNNGIWLVKYQFF